MKYTFLKINGISKICDDSYYYHNNELTNFQWYNFQLLYVMKLLKINIPLTGVRNLGILGDEKNLDEDRFVTDSNTGYILKRSQIYKYLVSSKYFIDGNIEIPKDTDSKELNRYGILKLDDQSDFYTHGHIGGTPNIKLELNSQNSDLISIPDQYR